MSYSENCRECGIEIESDITNPDALCEECLNRKYRREEHKGKKGKHKRMEFGGVF